VGSFILIAALADYQEHRLPNGTTSEKVCDSISDVLPMWSSMIAFGGLTINRSIARLALIASVLAIFPAAMLAKSPSYWFVYWLQLGLVSAFASAVLPSAFPESPSDDE
jgi:hypothetical protein